MRASSLALALLAAVPLAVWWLRADDAPPPVAAPAGPSYRAEARDDAPALATTAAAPEARRAADAELGHATLAGLVRDREGAPLRGATITVQPHGMPQVPARAVATSGDAGRFMVDVPLTAADGPDATWRVTAVAPGYAESNVDGATPSDVLEFALFALRELRCRVVDDRTDAPVVGASVVAGGETARTDADGWCTVQGVLVGAPCGLLTSAPGYATWDEHVELARDLPTEHVVRLRPAARVRVLVFDEASGAPIAGARVVRTGSAELLAETDAHGLFEVDLAPGVASPLVVSAEGYARFVWEAMYTGDPATAPPPRIPLRGLAWIEGSVTDELGRPVPGAALYVRNPESPLGNRMREETRRELGLPGDASWWAPRQPDGVDPRDGSFARAVLPAETPYEVEAYALGWIRTKHEGLALRAPGERARVALTLARGGALEGTVLWNDTPWSGGQVLARDAEDQVVAAASVAADGTYRMEGVPAMRLRVLLRGGYGPASTLPEPREVEVEPGATTTLDFVWSEATAAITGRVVDASGAAVEGAVVRADAIQAAGEASFRRPASVLSERDGTFSLAVPTDRRYRIAASHGSAHDAREDVAPGTSGIELVLPVLGTVELHLVDARTGRTAAVDLRSGSTLAWRPAGEGAYRWSWDLEVVAEGHVRVALPVGSIDLAIDASARGYAPVHLPSIPLSLEPGEPLLVALEPGLELELHLCPAEGAPVLFVLREDELDDVRFPGPDEPCNHELDGLRLWLAEPGLRARIPRWDGLGSARLSGLRPGRYHVRSPDGDVVFRPEAFDVVLDQRVELTWGQR